MESGLGRCAGWNVSTISDDCVAAQQNRVDFFAPAQSPISFCAGWLQGRAQFGPGAPLLGPANCEHPTAAQIDCGKSETVLACKAWRERSARRQRGSRGGQDAPPAAG